MTPRGIRNNNPGNIRHGDRWDGLSRSQSDPDFCVFDSMAYGLRALLMTLRTYHRKYGLDTVSDIITRWAPGNENDTEAYIRDVAQRMGVGADVALDLEDATTLLAVAHAIALHECGSEARSILVEDWAKALAMLR